MNKGNSCSVLVSRCIRQHGGVSGSRKSASIRPPLHSWRSSQSEARRRDLRTPRLARQSWTAVANLVQNTRLGIYTHCFNLNTKMWVTVWKVVARELTKSSMRRDMLSKLIAQRESDIETFIDFATKDFIQKSLKSYLESLQKPKKA